MSSYRRILKATSITGLSSVAVILVNLVKTKVLAVLTGAAGVGLLGVYGSFMGLVSAVGGMGLAVQGARDIAASLPADGMGQGVGAPGREAFRVARERLWWGSWVGALVVLLLTTAGIYGFRLTPLGAGASPLVTILLLLGAGLTILSAAQSVVIQGMRQLVQLAHLSIAGALLGSIVGIAALQVLPPALALTAFVIAAPVGTLLVGSLLTYRLLRRHDLPALSWPNGRAWRRLPPYLWAGLPIMLSGLVGPATQYGLRVMLDRRLDHQAVGLFQAAWAVGMQYLGLILTAMVGDYYPRLAGAGDVAAANRIVNQQTEVALVLAAPIVLAMIALAPLVIRVLYSSEFAAAADILRWQIIGDVGKLMAWPLGFLVLTRHLGSVFLGLEAIFGLVLLATVALLLPRLGIVATGLAFVPAYSVYLLATYIVARRLCGFRWSPQVLRTSACLAVAVVGAMVAVHWEPRGWLVGLAMAAVAAAHTVRHGRAMWRGGS